VPHRDKKVPADKQVRLAKDDVAVFHLRGVQHDEEHIAVHLQLGPLVRVARVFNGEIVQAEFLLHAVEHRVVGLMQTEPDKRARRVQHVADGLDGQVALTLAVAV
jgi:hypothetical protein